MKNIEKYPNTEDALNAWLRTEAVKGGDGQPLDGWLCEEYAEPNPPSLLEAAKAARDWMSSCVVMGAEGTAARGNLTAAIKAEETRPKRNFERFATAEEAFDAFRKACRVQQCEACHLKNKIMARTGGYVPCPVRWLYLSDLNLLRNEGAERAGRAEEKAEEEGKLEDWK